MDIEEAIQHCKDIADNCNNKECSLDHRQLMLWLIELKNYHKIYGNIDFKSIEICNLKKDGNK